MQRAETRKKFEKVLTLLDRVKALISNAEIEYEDADALETDRLKSAVDEAEDYAREIVDYLRGGLKLRRR